MIFSYLPGCVLFHKVAVLSKATRARLPNGRLLDQVKVIGINDVEECSNLGLPTESFMYAVSIADSIRITVDTSSIKYAKLIESFISMAAHNLKKPAPLMDFDFKTRNNATDTKVKVAAQLI